jgi:hypothetical protein
MMEQQTAPIWPVMNTSIGTDPDYWQSMATSTISPHQVSSSTFATQMTTLPIYPTGVGFDATASADAFLNSVFNPPGSTTSAVLHPPANRHSQPVPLIAQSVIESVMNHAAAYDSSRPDEREISQAARSYL